MGDVSSDFFVARSEGKAAINLGQSIEYLRNKREDPHHPEAVGATVVVIPKNKSLTDYKGYLRQYLPVSMQLNQDSLFCIFSHQSILHDGAVFVQGAEIVAVKAFFRLTAKYKNNPSIGHGTRHASAQEFSKHFKTRRNVPVTFVLSEEDGLIRSCINGKIKKIHSTDIAKLIATHHYNRCSNTGTQISQIKEECVTEGQNSEQMENMTITIID